VVADEPVPEANPEPKKSVEGVKEAEEKEAKPASESPYEATAKSEEVEVDVEVEAPVA